MGTRANKLFNEYSKAVVERRGFRPKFSMSQYLLKLYIMGDSSKSQRAIANIFRICREELSGLYTVEIIDVLEQPQLAEQDKILVTPTLVKQLPPPLQRIIGDMSNTQKVLLGLDVIPKDSHLN